VNALAGFAPIAAASAASAPNGAKACARASSPEGLASMHNSSKCFSCGCCCRIMLLPLLLRILQEERASS
jgi:succinate dehydrogenase/fumarate reductase-like Fe-S protein